MKNLATYLELLLQSIMAAAIFFALIHIAEAKEMPKNIQINSEGCFSVDVKDINIFHAVEDFEGNVIVIFGGKGNAVKNYFTKDCAIEIFNDTRSYIRNIDIPAMIESRDLSGLKK